jgi:hypothetical protein
MTIGKLTISWANPKTGVQREEAQKQQCKELGLALNLDGNIGETVEKVQKLILQYYNDVRDQATVSFRSAKRLAVFGFFLLVGTVAYVIFVDLMRHIPVSWFMDKEGGMSVGTIGLIGGTVVELIAGTQFVIHGRTARQFGAFHICLERTHRYLLAYKMAEQIKAALDRDKTLKDIVCIMANAPMITRQDIEGVESGELTPSRHKSDSDQLKVMSPEAGAGREAHGT